jgi:outer membrane protein OmpA-like peptidoglycan-associated protein
MISTDSKNSRSRTISRIKPLIIALGLICVNSLTSTAAAFDKEENQLTKIQTELSVTETELGNALNQINEDKRITALVYLQKGLTTTVYFRTGESDLPESNSNQLFELAQTLKDFPELQITMEGHAGIRGDGEFNQQLSESRVRAVQQILQDAGIPEQQIHCEAYGETEAMANNGDRENYIFYRRVSIHLSMGSTS